MQSQQVKIVYYRMFENGEWSEWEVAGVADCNQSHLHIENMIRENYLGLNLQFKARWNTLYKSN